MSRSMTMRCGDCGVVAPLHGGGEYELIRATRAFLDKHKKCHLGLVVQVEIPAQWRAEEPTVAED